MYLGVAFIPSSLFHLGLIFTDKEKTNKKWISLGYFFSFVFVFLSQTPYFIDGIYEYSWGVHSQARIFHHLFLLFFFSYSSLFVWNTYKYLKGASKENFVQVQQIKYFLVSFIILLSGSYAFLAAYNINFNPLGAYLLELLSVSILSFAITKYRLFETKALLTELLVISMAIVLFVLPFFMPTATLKIAAIIIFSLYSIVGYLLIKSTKKEVKAKEGLECVVKERTKELADRNEELEKWYKLTIGREVRMAELKEKIKEMEGKN